MNRRSLLAIFGLSPAAAVSSVAARDADHSSFSYRVRKLNLLPGDILVVKHSKYLKPEGWRRLQEHIRAAVGPDIKMLVLDRDTKLSVISNQTKGIS